MAGTNRFNPMDGEIVDIYKNMDITFSPFRRLPLELRLKTWRNAIYIPTNHRRILRVSLESKKDTFFFHFQRDKELSRELCDAVTSDLDLLRTCKESRSEYIRVFDSYLPGRNGSMIRFGKNDIVYMDVASVRLCRLGQKIEKGIVETPEWMMKIRHLALTESFYQHPRPQDREVKHFSLCPMLRCLYLVDGRPSFQGVRDKAWPTYLQDRVADLSALKERKQLEGKEKQFEKVQLGKQNVEDGEQSKSKIKESNEVWKAPGIYRMYSPKLYYRQVGPRLEYVEPTVSEGCKVIIEKVEVNKKA